MEPQTPIQALRLLADRVLVTSEELDDFVKLVRLRNLLVHRYWVVDDRRIYNSVRKDFRRVLSFIERVEDALQV